MQNTGSLGGELEDATSFAYPATLEPNHQTHGLPRSAASLTAATMGTSIPGMLLPDDTVPQLSEECRSRPCPESTARHQARSLARSCAGQECARTCVAYTIAGPWSRIRRRFEGPTGRTARPSGTVDGRDTGRDRQQVGSPTCVRLTAIRLTGIYILIPMCMIITGYCCIMTTQEVYQSAASPEVGVEHLHRFQGFALRPQRAIRCGGSHLSMRQESA